MYLSLVETTKVEEDEVHHDYSNSWTMLVFVISRQLYFTKSNSFVDILPKFGTESFMQDPHPICKPLRQFVR